MKETTPGAHENDVQVQTRSRSPNRDPRTTPSSHARINIRTQVSLFRTSQLQSHMMKTKCIVILSRTRAGRTVHSFMCCTQWGRQRDLVERTIFSLKVGFCYIIFCQISLLMVHMADLNALRLLAKGCKRLQGTPRHIGRKCC